jgi:hypothetical protein
MQRRIFLLTLFLLGCLVVPAAHAQQTLGTLSGTITDLTGATVANSTITLVDDQTAATRTATSNAAGNYTFQALPIGTYTLTIRAAGFNTEVVTSVLVQADRTSSLVIKMKPGAVSTSIDVQAAPQLNTTDPTNGYVLDSVAIENTPLGTGSFTQLATLSPGVQADPLADTGTNTGLGNQNIYANGQRLSSNTFTFNSVLANNLFNGASSSQVAESRAVLNTGESFQSNGTIRTNTSIFDAIGEALPSPPQQTIAEERVNTSMFDASQGATAGAHIDVTTKSGTNDLHGSVYGNWETSKLNANPYFNKQAGLPIPDLHRYVAGAELGGPILRDKLFAYGSYQYTRDRDQLNSQSSYYAPAGITSDRSATGLQAVVAGSGLPAGTPVDPVAATFLQAKLPNGQYLIRTPATPDAQVVFIGSASKFQADQANGNLDYVVSKKDSLAFKYYFQHDPTESPFSSTSLEGFPQQFNAASQVFSLENTTVLSPKLTWEQKFGFIRMNVASLTGQPFTPQTAGINLFGSTLLPGITIRNVNPNVGQALNVGPTSNFSNTGFAQNTFEGSSTLNWIVGRHSLSFGGNYDFTQLNIINRANNVASLTYNTFADFLTGGPLYTNGGASVFFQGASNRYYRSPQVGAFAQDQWKATNKLVVSAGIRFDNDGGLYEKYGNLVNFDPTKYSYNLATDTILNSGLVIAGNNKLYATPGASNSTLTNRQYGFGPRIGVAYSITPKLVVRSGFGLYYDRGEFFTNFSPSAGGGFNGPFGVTLQPPFVQPVDATASGTSENPFGVTRPVINTNPAAFIANLPNQAALINGTAPYLFGSYAANNKLPYTENYSLDFQYQLAPRIVGSVGFTGNHGVHQTVPLPFNQPEIATPTSPVNGQIYSYGYNAADANGNTLLSEPYNTNTGGNTDLRTPYIGYSPNSVEWSTVGWSHYDALLVSVHQQAWHGLEYQLSYTWSHSLDAASGFGLFYNGNDPRNLASGYASSDYDRTHVTSFSFNYQIPAYKTRDHLLSTLTTGFGLSGVTTFESGQPYNVYDFSGTVGSIFFSSNDFLTNPVLPLAPGVSAKQALTGHSGARVNSNGVNGVNPADVAFTPAAFTYPSLTPGQDGVPACGPTTAGTTACDTSESNFASGYRNIFRGSFQKRADLAIYKETKLFEKYRLRLAMEVFNITNTPSFDTPGNNFTGNPNFGNPPTHNDPTTGNTLPGATPIGPNAGSTYSAAFSSQGVGAITNPIGSPRQVQFYGIFSF